MARGNLGGVPVRLVRLAERFSSWRESRSSGERIPDRLWNAAARLAAEYGVNRTATVLSLDYYALKRRATDQSAEVVSDSFVELPSISVPSCHAASECIIELEDGAGASMRMHFKGADVADIVGVSRSLWIRE